MKFTLAAAILLLGQQAFSQSATKSADSLINYLIPNNEHAISVLIKKGDEILYEKVQGKAAPKKTVDENTIFRIGSVTKQFTAVAILKLVEEGKIKLDDTLDKFIADFPKGESVTIHHLLTHTSGIKSYTDQQGFLEKVEKPTKILELVKEIKGLGYEFEPGDQWKYNNSGYFLLGYIIEKVSGKNYSEYLSENIFQTTGMERSGVYANEDKYINEAIGYGLMDGKVKKVLDWQMTWAGGAGNIYSTCEDLITWNDAVFSGKIIEQKLLGKALEPVELNDGTNHPYGYGWAVDEQRGQKKYLHSGGLHGFLSYLTYYPELNASICVLSNASPVFKAVPATVSNLMSNYFFRGDFEFEQELDVDKSKFSLYEGQYSYPGGAILTVTQEEGRLYAQLTGQQKFEIFPKGDHMFFWKIVQAQIEFKLNNKGRVGYAIHKQNGSEAKVNKMEERKSIKFNSKFFKSYAGEYEMSGKWVKVWEEKGDYFTQIEGQPAFKILPKSTTRFFLEIMDVEIEFGEQSLTIFQSGSEIITRKK